MNTKIRRTPIFLFFFVLCCWCVACDDSGLTPHETEREKRLLALLEIRSETSPSSTTECLSIYALDSPDRYIYRRLPDGPSGTVLFEYDVPVGILDSMSTRGMLETGLGHPRNIELAPATVCSSIWRCRESMFDFLMNVWPVFEKRPDALEECLKRYDKLNILCDPLLRKLWYPGIPLDLRSLDALIQTSLIEVVLTRPSFLSQLSPKIQRKLAAKVLAKHRQKDMFYESELGKTQGLWLLCALMLHAKDSAFTELIRQDQEVELLSRGLVLGHNLRMKATVIAYAERFAAGK